MSWEAQKWVWDIENMAAGPKWVLMGIANYVDQEHKSWPGLATLSERLGMTIQSVINHVTDLVSDGFLIKERTKSHYGNNLYRLNLKQQIASKTAIKKYPGRGKKDKKTVKTILTDNPKQLKPFELKQLKPFEPNHKIDKPINKKIISADGADLPKSKLPPDLKAITDRIYNFDKQRFKNLIKWVYSARKEHFDLALIKDVLERFTKSKIGDPQCDWWAYLNVAINREEGKRNGRESEQQHEAEKEREANWARNMFGGNRTRS